MSSTIDINKICEWCGKEFIAHKCSTRFCSKRCSEHSYKALRRQAHIEQESHATSESKNKDVFQVVTTFHHDNVPFYWGLASPPCTAVLQRV